MSQMQSRKQINFKLSSDSSLLPTSPVDKIVANINKYSQLNGNLLQKYDQLFYLNYFDHNAIQQLGFKLGTQEEHKKQLKLQDFLRRFLSFIDHKPHQTIFLAMSLRRLFIQIKEQTNNQIGVKFSDFTNFLCERIAKDDPDMVAPFKQVPQQKINPDIDRVRQIDIHPPLVIKNDSLSDLPRIARTKKKKDKKLSERKPVSQFIFNFNTNQIITVGRLSSCIHIYDHQLKKKPSQIIPKTYLDTSRQIAILSMDFDEANQRIGVIINGMGLVFWEASDNYETQKTINKYFGEKIFYLRLFKEWVTTDKNTVYFWDLSNESVSKKIVNQEATMVNDICQINHLRCICVSYTTLDERKPFIVYKNSKPIARYDMGSAGCHSLHYNIPSQMIVTAGYHNTMEVFEIEDKTFSITLKKQLKGHSSIVTCISEIRNTNFILSGDDSGEIRIWELNFMKCIQVVKVSKYINEVYCTGEKLIYSDSRLNVMQMDKFSLPYMNDDEIIYQFFDQQTCFQFLVMRKCFRKVNFYTGRIEMVYVICDQDQEVSSAIKISAGIIIGTSKGSMKLYTTEGKERWRVEAHEGEITAVKYDRKTRFIFSLGSDGKLMIWPEKSLLVDGAKKVLTLRSKGFNILGLLSQVRIMFLASSEQNQISVWDYENLRLLAVIQLSAPAIFMDVNPLYRMLIVSTVNDEVCMFRLLWRNGMLDYEMVYCGDSVFSGLAKKKTVKYMLSISRQNVEHGPEEGTLVSRSKKSSKKLVSMVSISNENNQSRECDLFVTSSKCLDNEQTNFKKTGFKVTEEHTIEARQEQHNQHPIPSTIMTSTIMTSTIMTSTIMASTIIPSTIIPSTIIPSTIMPSIKLIREESQKPILQQTEQNLGTLKSLKRMQNEITTRIQIKNLDQSVYLVLGNSKGQVTCFDITLLIRENFSDYETQFKQAESPNIYRPARQDYDHELAKRKHSVLGYQSIKKIPKLRSSYFRLVWRQACASRQPVSCLSFVEMKHTYLTVSMTDGACKYYDLASGVLKADTRMNLPLPILWQVSIEKDLFIKKNIYQTLTVLDSLISSHGFQMLSKEYQAINVTSFLEMLKEKPPANRPISKSALPKPLAQKNQVILLSQQYSIQDVNNIIHGIRQTSQNETTLKSLQAIKRVNQIKQQMAHQQLNSNEKTATSDRSKVPSELLRQKEELQKLFAYNYFSVLGEHGAATKLNQSVELGSIEQRSMILLDRINETKKHQNNDQGAKKPPSKRLKRQASLAPSLPAIQQQQIHSMIFGRQDPSKGQNLVQRVSRSLILKSCGTKQKTSSEFPSALPSCTMISAILKNNTSSVSMQNGMNTKSAQNRSSENKENKYKHRLFGELDRSRMIEDKSARDILSQINEKLHRYKKSNYARRDIV